MERGKIVLIGATTENPSFEVNSALLSRSRVFVLHSLEKDNIIKLLKNVLKDKTGYGHRNIDISEELLNLIALYSNGDARTALNVLEMAVMSGEVRERTTVITKNIIEDCIQQKSLLYDNLEITVAVYNAVHYLGMPECNIYLTQAVAYLSVDPKSNALYTAYEKAKIDAKNTISEGVPLHLRNAPTKLMKDLNYGSGYEYSHNFENKVASLQCLPDNLKDRQYYTPTTQGVEKNIKERLETIKKLKKR